MKNNSQLFDINMVSQFLCANLVKADYGAPQAYHMIRSVLSICLRIGAGPLVAFFGRTSIYSSVSFWCRIEFTGKPVSRLRRGTLLLLLLSRRILKLRVCCSLAPIFLNLFFLLSTRRRLHGGSGEADVRTQSLAEIHGGGEVFRSYASLASSKATAVMIASASSKRLQHE